MISQLIFNALLNGVIYTLLAFSFYLVYSTHKFFCFSHGISLVLGCYLLSTLINEFNLVPSILISISLVIACQLFIHKYIYLALSQLKATPEQLLLASLAVYIVASNIIPIVWGDAAISLFPNMDIQHSISNDWLVVTDIQLLSLLVCISLLFVLALILKFTNIGLAIRAVASNTKLSNIFGLDVEKVQLASVAVASCLMVIAGVLIVADSALRVSLSFEWFIYGVIAMILGGGDKIKHMLIGAFLLAAVQQASGVAFGEVWSMVVTYSLLLLFVVLRPQGFANIKTKKVIV